MFVYNNTCLLACTDGAYGLYLTEGQIIFSIIIIIIAILLNKKKYNSFLNLSILIVQVLGIQYISNLFATFMSKNYPTLFKPIYL